MRTLAAAGARATAGEAGAEIGGPAAHSSSGGWRSAPRMPKPNRATTRRPTTSSACTPNCARSATIRPASSAIMASAAPRIAVRIRLVDREARRRALDPLREGPDGQQPEGEAADVREVGDAAAPTGRVAEVVGAEEDLLDEPEAEHEHRRNLD